MNYAIRAAEAHAKKCGEYADDLDSRPEYGGPPLSWEFLRGADLLEGRFACVPMVGTDLSGANLTDADLSHAKMAHAKMAHARLSRARLTGADLRGATMNGADLTGADLTDARRLLTDAPIPGWTLTADGTLAREASA